MKDGIPTFHASTRLAWREWLSRNHDSQKAVWLIIYKKGSETSSVYYPEAVDEALCFGWIDSKPNKRDEESYYQYFSKRNAKSNWSRVNKQKVKRLLEQGLMMPAGLEMVEIAKTNGTWNALNDVENLVVPEDLQREFDLRPTAWGYWQEFPPSARRGILEWIFNAKRTATRQKRILETVELAEKNIRVNQYRK